MSTILRSQILVVEANIIENGALAPFSLFYTWLVIYFTYINTQTERVLHMSTAIKEYDPHILYNAINLTVELRYKVPMQRIYKILEIIEKQNETNIDKITISDMVELLETLGSSFERHVAETDEPPSDDENLQSKIKELLRMLGCYLTDQELNKILKGEISLDDALSGKAKLVWKAIFHKDDKGKFHPNKEIVDQMLSCMRLIAFENVELKIQYGLENYSIQKQQQRSRDNLELSRGINLKTLYRKEPQKETLLDLEKKRNKLRLYIAHMQGYDRDRDRDGGRGVDMTTGIIVDFGDIYIADKSHGSIIEDRERNGIDIADIR